ncbi:MAG TPA: hypothetical protein VIY51_16650 [Xanthobacteraceae bacterium]
MEMASAITRTRAEVAEIRSDSPTARAALAGPEANGSAAPRGRQPGDVFAAAERIRDVTWAMRGHGFDPSTCQQLEQLAASILSASALRDPTDHRARKLGEVLQYLEHRIATLLESCREGDAPPAPEGDRAGAEDGFEPVAGTAAEPRNGSVSTLVASEWASDTANGHDGGPASESQIRVHSFLAAVHDDLEDLATAGPLPAPAETALPDVALPVAAREPSPAPPESNGAPPILSLNREVGSETEQAPAPVAPAPEAASAPAIPLADTADTSRGHAPEDLLAAPAADVDLVAEDQAAWTAPSEPAAREFLPEVEMPDFSASAGGAVSSPLAAILPEVVAVPEPDPRPAGPLMHAEAEVAVLGDAAAAGLDPTPRMPEHLPPAAASRPSGGDPLAALKAMSEDELIALFS